MAILAPVVTAAATAAGLAMSGWIPRHSVDLLYLLAVVLAATGLGTRMGLAVAVLSFLTYNFFFLHPFLDFSITHNEDVFALGVLLIVAAIAGSLAGRLRAAHDTARRRTQALVSLNDFAALLSGTRSVEDILRALARQAAETSDAPAIVLAVNQEKLVPLASWPGTIELSAEEWQRANSDIPGTVAAGDQSHPGSRFAFRPIIVGGKRFGVLGITQTPVETAVEGETTASLELILRHVSIAIERAEFEEQSVRARGEIERERLRSALLSSLSHDLRTPLASIVGAVSSLRELGQNMSAETRADLLLAIEEEAARLSRFVANLLHMTRLQSGDIDLRNDWVDLADVLQVAVQRARRIRSAPQITLRTPRGLPMIRGDAALLENVVFNVIENAVKFSEPGSSIETELALVQGKLVVSVSDSGPGISREDQKRVFEPFFRAKDMERSIPGTGLGLAIAKRVIDEMGGTIAITSPLQDNRGTRIDLVLDSGQQTMEQAP